MPREESGLPNDVSLADSLARVLGADVRILDRRPNDYSSTFPSEIVIVDSSQERRELFIKHETGTGRDEGWGERRGLAYEAQVYDHFLGESGTPRCYGLSSAPSGSRMLVLEYIRDTYQARSHPTDDVLELVAAWLGGFHRRCQALVHPKPEFLRDCTANERCAWSATSLAAWRDLDLGDDRWLQDLVSKHDASVSSEDPGEFTLIHGEFFPANVMMTRRNSVHPIDWESAARGAGELDVAMLIDGWGEAQRAAALEAYARRRWPDADTTDLDELVATAELSLAFRKIAETPGHKMAAKLAARLQWLRDSHAAG